MRRLGILELLSELTDWVNTLIIIVKKPRGKLRIWLDLKHLNQAIRRQHHKLPTVEKLFSKMHNAKIRC